MNKKTELAKNTLIILVGKMCTQFISFFLIPLYTNVLNTNEYGTIDLILTYVSLFVPVITLQIENAVFRFIIDNRNDEREKSKIITNALYSIAVLTIFAIVIYLCIINFFAITYKYYIILTIIVTIFSNLFLQIARGNGDNIGYSIGSAIAGISNVLLNLIFLLILKYGASSILLSACLSNLFCATYLIFKEKIYKFIKYELLEKEERHKLLLYSVPLIPNSIIWWIINVSDRTIISIFLGTGANGIYAISNKFSNLIASIYGIFNLSWTESISLHINDKDKDEFLSSTMETVIKFTVSLCTIIIICLPIIFNIIIGKNYYDSYKYIPFLIIGTFFNVIVSFIGGIYIALQKTKEIAKTSILSGIINIIANLILIRFIGIWAAVFSTIIAFLSMAIYRFIDIQKYAKIKINVNMIFQVIIIFIISIIGYYMVNLAINIILGVIIVILNIILNINLIKIIIKRIKNKILII